VSRNEAAGLPLDATNTFPAATAETHYLTLVTRKRFSFPAA
jgi:hypothetical protein